MTLGDQSGSFTVSFDAPTPPRRSAAADSRDRIVEQMFSVSGSSVTPKSRERRVRNKPDRAQKPSSAVNDPQLKDLVIPTPRRPSDDVDDAGADTSRSIDTHILLQDTEHVMKALEERHASSVASHSSKLSVTSLRRDAHQPNFDVFDSSSKSHKPDSHLNVSDNDLSDVSSTCALVEEVAMTSAAARVVTSAGKQQTSTPNRLKPRTSSGSLRRSIDASVTSDGFESEESESVASASTDHSHGAARIKNTRTNRAFDLRRSRTDADDDVTAVTAAAKDSARTDVSLGAKIVQKSRDNEAEQQHRTSQLSSGSGSQTRVKRSETFTRKDGGRFSLRSSKAGPLISPNKSASGAKHNSDLSRPRAGRLSLGGGSGGATSKRSSSKSTQPPLSGKRAEERDNLKRRTKYDPRRAIAEAKAREEERKWKRTRSADSTGSDTLNTSRTSGTCEDDDTLALGAESNNLGGLTSDDEITRLSSAVASDLNLLTAHAREDADVTQVR